MPRVIEHGVADVRTLDEPVVVEEGATCGESGRRLDLDVADEPVARQVDIVRELHGDPKAGMSERHIADQRVFGVPEMPYPRRVVEPRELSVDEKAGAADVAHGLVGVPDPRKVDVANGIVGVEAHEHVAISDDEASRHGFGGPSYPPGLNHLGFSLPPTSLQ